MVAELTAWRDDIAGFLESARVERTRGLAAVHSLGEDVLNRITRFAAEGKMIRGGLVRLAHELFDGTSPGDAVAAGAAVELLQSALLVHDDIMDRDVVRRGRPSVHHQYRLFAAERALPDDEHLGQSLGICAGDVAFFLAFELLAALDAEPRVVRRVVSLAAHELTLVGVAQMADVLRGAAGAAGRAGTDMLDSGDSRATPEEETLRIYLYKTGRYTFSLPLMLGAILGGGDDEPVAALEALGEKLGILFQLKDDEIGLFGVEEELGKPIGSDIREGKQTLYYHYLLAAARGADRERLLRAFGNKAVSDEDVREIRRLADVLGVSARVRSMADAYAAETRRAVAALSGVNERRRRTLEELVDYNLTRTK